uniref:Uncharacterized protein n=1 Tax=Chromera velia CCMP2878 TaxID=1169474 RepID=A0A0G4HGV1_9ALVE|eukprot:Cvel_27400.t1-p1 / transcript=Cvel_27400.t1 / gene=Cvel_27400 / organism=Chromera_velia_CCMP2878 / gene_product=hypothetical protein / transcript_product=hypothetical protein / location=Cvel_scaffold3415:10111-12972(-) / protein_length=775 / sequence_SO=supercontig / SO=protein_coding / is_pseudo=false
MASIRWHHIIRDGTADSAIFVPVARRPSQGGPESLAAAAAVAASARTTSVGSVQSVPLSVSVSVPFSRGLSHQASFGALPLSVTETTRVIRCPKRRQSLPRESMKLHGKAGLSDTKRSRWISIPHIHPLPEWASALRSVVFLPHSATAPGGLNEIALSAENAEFPIRVQRDKEEGEESREANTDQSASSRAVPPLIFPTVTPHGFSPQTITPDAEPISPQAINADRQEVPLEGPESCQWVFRRRLVEASTTPLPPPPSQDFRQKTTPTRTPHAASQHNAIAHPTSSIIPQPAPVQEDAERSFPSKHSPPLCGSTEALMEISSEGKHNEKGIHSQYWCDRGRGESEAEKREITGELPWRDYGEPQGEVQRELESPHNVMSGNALECISVEALGGGLLQGGGSGVPPAVCVGVVVCNFHKEAGGSDAVGSAKNSQGEVEQVITRRLSVRNRGILQQSVKVGVCPDQSEGGHEQGRWEVSLVGGQGEWGSCVEEVNLAAGAVREVEVRFKQQVHPTSSTTSPSSRFVISPAGGSTEVSHPDEGTRAHGSSGEASPLSTTPMPHASPSFTFRGSEETPSVALHRLPQGPGCVLASLYVQRVSLQVPMNLLGAWQCESRQEILLKHNDAERDARLSLPLRLALVDGNAVNGEMLTGRVALHLSLLEEPGGSFLPLVLDTPSLCVTPGGPPAHAFFRLVIPHRESGPDAPTWPLSALLKVHVSAWESGGSVPSGSRESEKKTTDEDFGGEETLQASGRAPIPSTSKKNALVLLLRVTKKQQ